MNNKITAQVVKKLRLPKKSSHKGENGRLLVIAGSKKYHGSLMYAVKAAAKVADLIYVLTTKENQGQVRKLKSRTAEFISISHSELDLGSKKRSGFRLGGRNDKIFDCILIGPGMGVSRWTYKLVERVLKSGVKAVLDADALNVLDKKLLKLLSRRHILTPHAGEFTKLLARVATSPLIPLHPPATARHERAGARGGKGRGRNVAKEFAHKYGCTVVLKGKVDIVASPDGQEGLNYTGNSGMTKGGTGDVLAGLIAALFAKNDAYTSAAAGVFLNGLAGDELYKKVGPFYDGEDLVDQIPKTLWNLINHKQ